MQMNGKVNRHATTDLGAGVVELGAMQKQLELSATDTGVPALGAE